MAGIYFHIPFCKQACHYCDFHFSTNLELREPLLKALRDELRLQKEYLDGETLETIYFGGGTPSLLSREELVELLDTMHSFFPVKDGAEITLEANPDDLTAGRLAELKLVGVNRLSIGIQSFDDEILKFFNRAHTAADAVRSYQESRLAGFSNISIDLIYGIPGRGNDSWSRDIDRACQLSPEHISAYALTIEEKTVFGTRQARKELVPMDDDAVATQFETLMRKLAAAGYEHYEISNFAAPGFQSRHNSSYWQQKKFLGIGPSAHSFDGVSRQFNVRNNGAYVRQLGQGKVPAEKEILTRGNKVNEFVLTRLRTSTGLDVNHLQRELGYDLAREHHALLKQLVGTGHVEREGSVLKLTNKGKLLADKIAADLFVSPE